MYNFLEQTGTIKGLIGELLFCQSNTYARWTKLRSYDWLDTQSYEIPLDIKQFLKQYWGTIDVFELVIMENRVEQVIFYEVKTSKYAFKKQCMTSRAAKFYEICQEKGFIVKSVLVLLHSNWQYELKISDYAISNYTVYDSKSLLNFRTAKHNIS
jgi:hypothetical protein